MNWFRKNSKVIAIVCAPTTITLAAMGVVSAVIPLLILASIICITGAVAFVIDANKVRSAQEVNKSG